MWKKGKLFQKKGSFSMCMRCSSLHYSFLLPSCCALQVGKDDIDTSKPSAGLNRLGPSPLVNQYSLTVGLDLGPHDTKSLMKCVESLSFIVRDAAHVTPENFELCVKTIRIFVEASLNGGKMAFDLTAGIRLEGAQRHEGMCEVLLGNESPALR